MEDFIYFHDTVIRKDVWATFVGIAVEESQTYEEDGGIAVTLIFDHHKVTCRSWSGTSRSVNKLFTEIERDILPLVRNPK